APRPCPRCRRPEYRAAHGPDPWPDPAGAAPRAGARRPAPAAAA
ncbi:MAG: hypothetical protein AVDCRST_MAG68-4312, partial [uncultured Gemmatimonadetes bacterium]